MANDGYIKKSDAEAALRTLRKGYRKADEKCAVGACILEIQDISTADVVSRGVLDQIRWERDVAMEQLKDHGIPFCGIAPDVVKVVRCKDCKHGIWDEEEQMWECVLAVDLTGDADTYAMFHEYNDGEHFCSYGERKDNDL